MFSNFMYYNPVKIIYGIDSIKQLPEEIKVFSHDNKAVTIVTDTGIINAGITEKILSILRESGFKYSVFSEVESNPSFASVNKLVEVIKSNKSTCVIGLGGGSPIDVAKLGSVAASDNMPAESYAFKRDIRIPPVHKEVNTIAIPTTAGTGAEVTQVGVYSDENKKKLWTVGFRLNPQTAIIDPKLTIGLPPILTAATGLDALVHAIEAITGKLGNNPMVRAYSLQAIQLIHSSLEKAINNGDDIKARENMILGSTLAGMAIEAGNTAMAHGMGHALSSIAGIHHGRAVALCLDAIYAWNAEAFPKVHAEIAKAMGIDPSGKTEMELAMVGAKEYSRLLSKSGISLSLKDDGLSIADLDRFVNSINAKENRGIVGYNRREPSDKDIIRFARAVLER